MAIWGTISLKLFRSGVIMGIVPFSIEICKVYFSHKNFKHAHLIVLA